MDHKIIAHDHDSQNVYNRYRMQDSCLVRIQLSTYMCCSQFKPDIVAVFTTEAPNLSVQKNRLGTRLDGR